MPALPSVPNVLKVVIKGISGESTPINWANVLHFLWSGTAPTVTSATAIANNVITQWGTHMAPEQVNNITMNEVDVIDLTSDTAAAVEIGADTPGTRGDDEIPANVAFLIDSEISRRYRGGHPRTYLIVGGNADFLDAAHWSTAFTAEVASHWDAFLGAVIGFASGGCLVGNQCSVSYVSKEENPIPPYYRAVPIVDVMSGAYVTVEQQMASQRRRIGRHRA